jgi:fructuronate reductase
VLERFANRALAHRCAQIAQDGSQKLPPRLLGGARDLLAAGVTPTWTALAVAAWMVHVAAAGRAGTLEDPLADRLAPVSGAAGGAAALVDGLLAVPEVFGPDLPASPVFRDAVLGWVEPLRRGGPAAALSRAARP